jgi:hypothetical protein
MSLAVSLAVPWAPAPAEPAPPPTGPAIASAIQYLDRQQATAQTEAAGMDWAGDWPQYASSPSLPGLRAREISPFVAAFTDHSLWQITSAHRSALGLSASQIEAARRMRQRAVAFIERSVSPSGRADAGTYGFWPVDASSGLRVAVSQPLRAVANLLPPRDIDGRLVSGPSAYPLPSDADDTAAAYAALNQAHRVDGAPAPSTSWVESLARWRDRGPVPVRQLDGRPSGAYLTWLEFPVPGPGLPYPSQDVDLVENANILFSLGYAGLRNAPGMKPAIALINRDTVDGRYHDIASVSRYYPNTLVFDYAVTRAYGEGHVTALRPAVDAIVHDLASTARRTGSTTAWDLGNPTLNTAYAVLSLMYSGGPRSMIRRGVQYLVDTQRRDGSWPMGPFFLGAIGNTTVYWDSTAFATGMSMEALARYALDLRGSRP